MNTHHQDQQQLNSDESSTRERRRKHRPVVGLSLGLLAGLLAGGGVGLAVQSAGASSSDRAPMGAQLPWDDASKDDSTKFDDNERGERMHDRMRDRMHGSDARRSPRVGGGADRRMQMEGRIDGLRNILDTAAETLGMTPEELREGLRDGKSIADIAGEKDVAVEDVIDALVEKITENLTERITELVNRTPPMPQN